MGLHNAERRVRRDQDVDREEMTDCDVGIEWRGWVQYCRYPDSSTCSIVLYLQLHIVRLHTGALNEAAAHHFILSIAGSEFPSITRRPNVDKPRIGQPGT